ncbi:FAD:protein FMN transferase [Candidatus Bipolaricaulota bacterium]|nr:FAD:protein FMN transferase [Candidatus Bipolaricaulota bacterium]
MTTSDVDDLTRRKFLKLATGGLLGAGALTLGLKPWKNTAARGVNVSQTRPAMGTFVEITAYGEEEDGLNQLIDGAYKKITEVDETMSVFKDQSRVYRLNVEGTRKVNLTSGLVEVLREGQRISEITEGSFDMTIAPLLDLWGFYEHELTVPAEKELRDTLKLVDYRGLEVDRADAVARLPDSNAAIDLGGIAKGYAVDKAVEFLKGRGATAGLVNAGGDIRAFGSPEADREWKIGLQHPLLDNRLLGAVNLILPAITTSGNYESFFTYQGSKLSHIIDPGNGRPVEDTLSVSVLTDRAIVADGLSTGLFSQDARQALTSVANLEDTEIIYIWKEDQQIQVDVTDGLEGEVDANGFEKELASLT